MAYAVFDYGNHLPSVKYRVTIPVKAMATKADRHRRAAKESDYRALAEFRYHIGRYLDFSDQAARAAGIEPGQYQLLLAIRGLPKTVEPSVGALAQQLRRHHHSTVELINRAESHDLVRRLRLGTRVLVRLTRKGERVLTRAVEERLREIRVAGPVLVEALQELTNTNHNSIRKRK
jgi:DNA-binding MarR family transcriptional regulator